MRGKSNNFKKMHAINSWLNMFLSTLIVVCVFISIVINLLANPTEVVQEVGIKTFRMFTVLSNIFVGITAAMSIPFAVDGIRQRNYHLPRWIVNITFASVTCVTLTFLVALVILSPQAGFVLMMATRSNLFLHTIVPVAAMVSFLFVNTYHTVKFRATVYALLPVFVYAVLYIVLAFFVGEENGGWRDHYRFEELMPWYYVFFLVIALTFGIATLLRTVHNRMHQRDKAAGVSFYHNAPEYDLPTIEEAIAAIARENKKHDTDGELIIPRRIIMVLEKKYESKKPLSCLCRVYLDEYMK